MVKILLRKIMLYWNTIRYLSCKQIIWRVYLKGRSFAENKLSFTNRGARKNRLILKDKKNRPLNRILNTPWESVLLPKSERSIKDAEEYSRFNFIFLNHGEDFSTHIRWHDENIPLLWRYHMQYFDYALTLAQAYKKTGQNRYFNLFKEIFYSWKNNNSWGRGTGWHPYPLSLRLVNWMYAYDLFEKPFSNNEDFKNDLLGTIYNQLSFLMKHLEYDVGGNHLLENARALTAGGLFFYGTDARKWFSKGVKLWNAEFPKQILQDGGHYERSPLYHCRVLKNVGECYYWLEDEDPLLAANLKEALGRMYCFYYGMVHPDGNIALFNDSVLLSREEKDNLTAAGMIMLPSLRDMVSFGIWDYGNSKHDSVELYSFCNSGYFGLRENKENGTYLMIDCGPLCPDELPAHAHGDMLSLEVSRGKRRIVVDSGVTSYAAGPWREFSRSTRAHNTVEIGGQDQCELWGSFRVGKRVKPVVSFWKKEKDWLLFQGKHAGYKEKYGVEHIRNIIYFYQGIVLVADRLRGNKVKKGPIVSSFIHLHPDTKLESEKKEGKNHETYVLWGDWGSARFIPLAADRVKLFHGEGTVKGISLLQGWYMPSFGVKIPNYVITLEQNLENDCILCYLLDFSGEQITADISKQKGNYLLKVAIGEQKYDIELSDATIMCAQSM